MRLKGEYRRRSRNKKGASGETGILPREEGVLLYSPQGGLPGPLAGKVHRQGVTCGIGDSASSTPQGVDVSGEKGVSICIENEIIEKVV